MTSDPASSAATRAAGPSERQPPVPTSGPAPAMIRRRRLRRTGQVALAAQPGVAQRGADVRRPSGFLLLGALVAVLNIIGLVMVLSASSVQSLQESGSTWTYFLRQATWLALSTVALVVTAKVDYRRWRRLALPLLGLSMLLLMVVLHPALGVKVNGARSWFDLGPFRIQPSELAKLALLLFCADLLARRSHRLADSRLTLRPVLLVGGMVTGLVLVQSDLGAAIVIGAIVVSILFLAGIPLGRLTGVLGLGAVGFLGMALGETYRRDRLLVFLHPGADPLDTGYQITQSLTGVASGGLFGVGLGASRAKYGFLPMPTPTSSSPSSGRSWASSEACWWSVCSSPSPASACVPPCLRPTASACSSPAGSPRGCSPRPWSTSAGCSGSCPSPGSPCLSSPSAGLPWWSPWPPPASC